LAAVDLVVEVLAAALAAVVVGVGREVDSPEFSGEWIQDAQACPEFILNQPV
jgi:hypothetical protein